MTRPQAAIAAGAGVLVLGLVAWLLLSRQGEVGGGTAAGGVEEVEGVAGETRSLRLYFPSDRGRLMVEERELGGLSGAALLEAAATELLAGPLGPRLYAPFPAGTELGSVFISSAGIAYVDLVSTSPDPPMSGSRDEMLSVYSFVNTLEAALPELGGVVLLWNGQQRPSFAGHLDTGRPLTTNEALVLEAG